MGKCWENGREFHGTSWKRMEMDERSWEKHGKKHGSSPKMMEQPVNRGEKNMEKNMKNQWENDGTSWKISMGKIVI